MNSARTIQDWKRRVKNSRTQSIILVHPSSRATSSHFVVFFKAFNSSFSQLQSIALETSYCLPNFRSDIHDYSFDPWLEPVSFHLQVGEEDLRHVWIYVACQPEEFLKPLKLQWFSNIQQLFWFKPIQAHMLGSVDYFSADCGQVGVDTSLYSFATNVCKPSFKMAPSVNVPSSTSSFFGSLPWIAWGGHGKAAKKWVWSFVFFWSIQMQNAYAKCLCAM